MGMSEPLDLAGLEELCADEFVGGSRVINCMAHCHIPLTERPDECRLCLSDLRNHFAFAIRVNEWLNAHWEPLRTALPAAIKHTRELEARLVERALDTERMDWLAETGKGGRFPGTQFGGGWAIRDIYGILLGEGDTLRAAIDAARESRPAEERKL